jgi:hypothetical protein
MSNIGSIGSSGYAMMPQRPDPAKMTDALFAKLDTTGKGYLEKSDLQSALNPTDSKTSVDAAFAKLDSNSDGKLTKSEVSDGIKKLADALGNQLNQTRMGQGPAVGKGGPPPPPPPNKSASSSDSSSSTSSNTSIDPADSNGDGTVSAQEALAYADKKSTTTETSSSGSSTSLTATNQAGKSLKLIMGMMSAYNNTESNNSNLSVSA